MLPKKLQSRKFLLACGSILFVIITEGIGADIPKDAYYTLLGAVVAYILGEAYVDAKK